MIRAVLLIPGPSLAKLDGAIPPCDVSIAVKRAALHFAADWAVILDKPPLKAWGADLRGEPKLLTMRENRPRYTTRAGMDLEVVSAWCPCRCSLFTTTAALALAGYLGAKRIDAYGADWTGEPEFDGHVPQDCNYTPARWELERKEWDGVAEWLKGQGVEVGRIQSR